MALGSKFLEYEIKDGAAWVTINRPEARNACTMEMYSGIGRACAEADENPDIQITVITGSGDSFCVGGDMRGSESFVEDDAGKQRDMHRPSQGASKWRDPFTAIEQSRKLVVAAVNGHCHAGGFIIALAADITIASERASFRVPEPLRGIADSYVCTRLPLYVGMERAKNLMLTCRTLDAKDAERWGLVSEYVPHERLHERTDEILSLLMRTGPNARSDYKAQANRLFPEPDHDMMMRSMSSEECREGFAAFSQKRPASWVPAGRVIPSKSGGR